MQPILQANGIGPKGQLVTHPLELCAISSLCVQIVTEKGKKREAAAERRTAQLHKQQVGVRPQVIKEVAAD